MDLFGNVLPPQVNKDFKVSRVLLGNKVFRVLKDFKDSKDFKDIKV